MHPEATAAFREVDQGAADRANPRSIADLEPRRPEHGRARVSTAAAIRRDDVEGIKAHAVSVGRPTSSSQRSRRGVTGFTPLLVALVSEPAGRAACAFW